MFANVFPFSIPFCDALKMNLVFRAEFTYCSLPAIHSVILAQSINVLHHSVFAHISTNESIVISFFASVFLNIE